MKKMVMSAVVAAALGAFAAGFEFERPCVVPEPASADYKLSACTELDDGFVLRLWCAQDAEKAADWLRRHVKEALGVDCRIEEPPIGALENLGPEEYRLSTYRKGAEIRAAGLAGVRHAFSTLRQLVQPKRGTAKVAGWICPAARIADKPKFAFRGIHLCWFPETTSAQIERAIRLAAYYKFNYAVLETWGAFRSEKYPWYGWADGRMTKQEVARLVAVGRELGVTLVPQLNAFGHASMCRWSSGKHAGLDFHPEYQPLFEPHNGWNWCLSNPEAKKMIRELASEMLEAFGNPPYFHIGCDEAMPPSCPECRAADWAQLVGDHVVELSAFLKARGADAMMWHDMLLKKGEWGRFYANAEHGEEKILDRLPQNVVVCDWFYNAGVSPEGYPTFKHFAGKGLRTLTCPWRSPEGTRAQGKAAAEAGLFGVLGTTWHHLYGPDVEKIFVPTADAAWRGGAASSGKYFLTHLRQIGWDMKLSDPLETGIYNEQLPGRTISPCGD